MIKCILWDIDATVLDFLSAESASLKSTFKKLNLGECTDEAVAVYSKINQGYWQRLERGEVTKSQVLHNRFVDFLQTQGITNISAEEICREYENGLGDIVVFIDNSFELLRELKGEYKQYAVTNGAYAVQTRKLAKSGLNDIFDGVFISDSVGYEKPSSEFFEYALAHIEPFSRDEILIVGDSLTSDMQGGNNAGIKCCWYNPNDSVNDKSVKIDFEIHNLNEIKELLKHN